MHSDEEPLPEKGYQNPWDMLGTKAHDKVGFLSSDESLRRDQQPIKKQDSPIEVSFEQPTETQDLILTQTV